MKTWMKMYFLSSMVIFQCHFSFLGYIHVKWSYKHGMMYVSKLNFWAVFWKITTKYPNIFPVGRSLRSFKPRMSYSMVGSLGPHRLFAIFLGGQLVVGHLIYIWRGFLGVEECLKMRKGVSNGVGRPSVGSNVLQWYMIQATTCNVSMFQ